MFIMIKKQGRKKQFCIAEMKKQEKNNIPHIKYSHHIMQVAYQAIWHIYHQHICHHMMLMMLVGHI
ncbi:hypothetical protein BW14_06350 [Bifidobacterium sp. UTBIF-68]|nr:hypothetical protein BW14_06350 [Bifidobacterium sp. UTBIF-68]